MNAPFTGALLNDWDLPSAAPQANAISSPASG